MKTLLPTSLLAAVMLTASLSFAQTDRVGIGTTTPRAGLDVTHNDGIVATGEGLIADLTSGPDFCCSPGPGNTSNLPTGGGTRLLWVPARSAFRAGSVRGEDWNAGNLGLFSTAMGYHAVASGHYSTALGNNVNTNGQPGSFIVGDASLSDYIYNVVPLLNDLPNQFMARFTGGYKFITGYTFEPANTVGVYNRQPLGAQLLNGQTAWSTLSDSTKKEGFRPADGAQFLQKIAAMRLGSWNYKGQDKTTMRHYGPMAQDFFAAFGHDGVGTIGNNTTINQADFDGVNLTAIQALVRENDARRAEVQALRAELAALKTQNAALNQETASLRADVDSIKRLLVANTGK